MMATGRNQLLLVAMDYDLPTRRSISRTGYRVHVWCKACRHPRIDMVCTSKDVVRPL